jgi:hypothetical protein
MQAAGGLNLSAIQRHGRSLTAGHTPCAKHYILRLTAAILFRRSSYKRFAWPDVSVAWGEREAIRDPSQATQEA